MMDAIPCPAHPFSIRTHLGCCQCHGEALAAKDKGMRPNWHRSRRTQLPELEEPMAPAYESRELIAMVQGHC